MKTKLTQIPDSHKYKITGKNKTSTYLYKCVCGNIKRLMSNNVKSGGTKSCGCLFHLQSRTPLYRVWGTIKQRCNNKNYKGYKYYGGRGISISPEWQTFPAFKLWAQQTGYKKGLTIDRVNNDGDYTPENCRWATQQEQLRNTRQNVTYKGEVARDAARRLGGHEHLVTDRIRRGWSKEKAFNEPINKNYAQSKN